MHLGESYCIKYNCGGKSGNPKFKIQPIGNCGEDYVANLYQDF